MKTLSFPRFDHGAALRVPPPGDAPNRGVLEQWLGDCGAPIGAAGHIRVETPHGCEVARPGDWIVLSVSGAFHVTRMGGSAA